MIPCTLAIVKNQTSTPGSSVRHSHSQLFSSTSSSETPPNMQPTRPPVRSFVYYRGTTHHTTRMYFDSWSLPRLVTHQLQRETGVEAERKRCGVASSRVNRETESSPHPARYLKSQRQKWSIQTIRYSGVLRFLSAWLARLPSLALTGLPIAEVQH